MEFFTSTRIERIEQDDAGVTVFDQNGRRFRGVALIGADGVKSVVREQFVGDPARVTGHVVYRAVVEKMSSRTNSSGMQRASGSAPIATWFTTRCAAASNTTWW